MKICKIECRVYFVYILTAIGYYSSFLINTQAHEYRYFAPSFYILFITLVCSSIALIRELMERKDKNNENKNNEQFRQTIEK